MAHAPSYPPTHPPTHPPTCYSRLAAGGRPGAPRAAGPRGDLLRGGLLTSSRTIAPPRSPRGSGGAAAPLAPARCSHKAVAKAVTKLQYSSMNVTGIAPKKKERNNTSIHAQNTLSANRRAVLASLARGALLRKLRGMRQRRRWHCLRAVLVTVCVIVLVCWSRQVHTLPTLRPRLQHRPPRQRPAEDALKFSTLEAVVRQSGMANLSTALGSADIFITFGSSSLLPFVLNWVAALRHHGVWRLMVGALDEELRAACEASGVPSLHIGAADQRRGASGYFRKDYEAFKRMGLAKAPRAWRS